MVRVLPNVERHVTGKANPSSVGAKVGITIRRRRRYSVHRGAENVLDRDGSTVDSPGDAEQAVFRIDDHAGFFCQAVYATDERYRSLCPLRFSQSEMVVAALKHVNCCDILLPERYDAAELVKARSLVIHPEHDMVESKDDVAGLELLTLAESGERNPLSRR